MSFVRRIKRGKFKVLYNDAINKFETYRLSKRGVWILTVIGYGDVKGATQLSKHEMNKNLENENE